MPSQPSILIALLRNDLRIVDQAIFHAAHLESRVASRVTHVLPVYVFDERQIELSGIEGYEKASKKEARTPVGKVCCLTSSWELATSNLAIVVLEMQRQ